MHVQGELFVPLLAFFLHVRYGTASYADEDTEVVVWSMDVSPLKCYRCYEYEEGCQALSNVTNIEVQECQRDEHFCQVRRLDNRDVLQTFERSCSRECTPGCRTMLYRTLCISCCSSSLCNTDSAPGVPTSAWHVMFMAGLVTKWIHSV